MMTRFRSSSLLGLLAALLVGLPGSLHAGMEAFLRLEDIKGEATDKRHSQEIQILAWSWGLSQTVARTSGGTSVGKPDFQNLQLTKYSDASSPALLAACARGDIIKKGVLTVRKVAGTSIDFYQIELEQILISSITLGGSGGEDRLTENISLNFGKLRVTYFPVRKHQAEPGVDSSWSIPDGQGSQSQVSPSKAAYISYLGSELTFASGAPTTTLTWPSVAGVTYRLRFSERPEGPYQAYGDYPSAGDGTTTITLPVSAVGSFFLVEQIASP